MPRLALTYAYCERDWLLRGERVKKRAGEEMCEEDGINGNIFERIGIKEMLRIIKK